MLVVVVVLFAFCWLPLYAVNVRILFGPPLVPDQREFHLLSRTVIPLAQWLGLSSCAVNPIVYCLFSAKFRDGFRALLVAGYCCCGAAGPVIAVHRADRRWSAGLTTDHVVTTLDDNKQLTAHQRTSRSPLIGALEMRRMTYV